jgi:hypothetical protein
MSLIEITDRGDQVLRELLPEHFAAERAMAACLNANEKELLIGLLGSCRRISWPRPSKRRR